MGPAEPKVEDQAQGKVVVITRTGISTRGTANGIAGPRLLVVVCHGGGHDTDGTVQSVGFYPHKARIGATKESLWVLGIVFLSS
jgi:hypothetical protein